MQISVLGPVEVSIGGQPVAIGAGKPRALLAFLALHEGTAITTDRLVEGLWGEDPPSSAHKMVQLYVSQLRKALANGGDGGEIVTRGRGYELRFGNGGLDAHRFEQLITGGMPREALVLWRGAPLADVADEPFAGGEIRRLEELRLRAIELAVDTDLAGGRHREVVGEIEAAAVEESTPRTSSWASSLSSHDPLPTSGRATRASIDCKPSTVHTRRFVNSDPSIRRQRSRNSSAAL